MYFVVFSLLVVVFFSDAFELGIYFVHVAVFGINLEEILVAAHAHINKINNQKTSPKNTPIKTFLS